MKDSGLSTCSPAANPGVEVRSCANSNLLHFPNKFSAVLRYFITVTKCDALVLCSKTLLCLQRSVAFATEIYLTPQRTFFEMLMVPQEIKNTPTFYFHKSQLLGSVLK